MICGSLVRFEIVTARAFGSLVSNVLWPTMSLPRAPYACVMIIELFEQKVCKAFYIFYNMQSLLYIIRNALRLPGRIVFYLHINRFKSLIFLRKPWFKVCVW